MPAKSCLDENDIVFVNRRRGEDRRLDEDRCKDLSMDLFHRKRRKSAERRSTERTLADDFMAFNEKHNPSEPPVNLSS